ncbi:MAG TPA: helix-turn-helix domain-containing protein [Bacillota bacterium]
MKTYTVAEYARLYKVSPKTVYKLIHSGQLSARRFGRVLRIVDPDGSCGTQSPAGDDPTERAG